ncbi:family 43 glycosylhydrolase [Olivibacter sp. SDN3]|nr:family 43 glycosylhydrolase [Olivibacter sp. SDN3]
MFEGAVVHGQRLGINPAVPGDFADPSVIRAGELYYATGTSSEWAPHFPLFKSSDLQEWEQAGYLLMETPEWASASFWAPELFYHQDMFYLYYTARRKSDGVSCIGVATSPSMDQPFKDHGVLIAYGSEAIDAFVFDDNGQLYITWKAYGLDERPIEILGASLSADGLKLNDDTFTLLKDEQGIGIEGQCLVKRNEYYYLLYSAGACCGLKCDYNVRVARSKSVTGPYEDFEKNPILAENSEWQCPGHGTLVSTPEGKDYYMYHAYRKSDNVFTGRQGLLDELYWEEASEWPYFDVDGKSLGIIAEDLKKKEWSDDFTGKGLADLWQWDFRHASPKTSINEGVLLLSGETDSENLVGTALTIRPAYGEYAVTTEVTNQNASLKSLVVYGDMDQAIGVGVRDGHVELWEVKDGKRQVFQQKQIAQGSPVQLKIEAQEGAIYRFFYKQQNQPNWTELKDVAEYPYKASFLPPWDRSPRPGLVHQGELADHASFSNFTITYGTVSGVL